MIIDSFTFFNEFDLLEFRLRLLYDIVDKFVLVEADKTFSGKDKPFYFEENATRFAWAKDKLVPHKAIISLEGLSLTEKPTSYDPNSSYFRIEYQQRNAIAEACRPFSDDNIFLLSDVDEIPSREAVILANSPASKAFMPCVCDQKLFYYNLNCLVQTPWRGTIITTMQNMRENSPQILRNLRNRLSFIGNAGWHLSYFGNTDFIANKIDSSAHQEFNTETMKNQTSIEECVTKGVDLYGRSYEFSHPPRDSFPDYFLALAAQNESFFFGNAAK
jgi:hypothetical protein